MDGFENLGICDVLRYPFNLEISNVIWCEMRQTMRHFDKSIQMLTQRLYPP